MKGVASSAGASSCTTDASTTPPTRVRAEVPRNPRDRAEPSLMGLSQARSMLNGPSPGTGGPRAGLK